MNDTLRTRMGQQFLSGTMPEIARQLKRIADRLDEQAGARRAPEEDADWHDLVVVVEGGVVQGVYANATHRVVVLDYDEHAEDRVKRGVWGSGYIDQLPEDQLADYRAAIYGDGDGQELADAQITTEELIASRIFDRVWGDEEEFGEEHANELGRSALKTVLANLTPAQFAALQRQHDREAERA